MSSSSQVLSTSATASLSPASSVSLLSSYFNFNYSNNDSSIRFQEACLIVFELVNDLFYVERVLRLCYKLFFLLILFTYSCLILVSGGLFLAIVLVPFLGYKLYQKLLAYYGCVTSNTFLFCGSSTSRRQQRENYGNFLRKKVSPRVEFQTGSNFRVGESVTIKVIFPLSQHRSLEIVQSVPEGHPSVHEHVHVEQEYSLDKLVVEVVKVSHGALASSSPRVVPIMELLPRVSNAGEDVLLVKVVVQEAGFYQLSISYDNEHIGGSPFNLPFSPAVLDPLRTTCLRESPILLCMLGESLTVTIRPLDKFGNECNYGDVDPLKFHFKLVKQDSQDAKCCESLIYNFTREFRRRDFDNIGSLSDCNEDSLEVKLESEVNETGVFAGVITYEDVVIEKGTFDLVTLSGNEFRALQKMSNNPASFYHEAKLVALGNNNSHNSESAQLRKSRQKVYIYISSKTLVVKEFFLVGLIPYRIATFRILPATQLRICKSTGNSTVVCISDRTQQSLTLEMDESSCRVLFGTFALFLKQRLGGAESFENKQRFFFEELKKSRDVSSRNTAAVVNIQRSALISSTMLETKGYGVKDWARNFKVKFNDEEGSDDGGLRREWLNLVCKSIFDNNSRGMFCSLGNSRLVHINPAANRDSKWTLKYYELAGKIVGKCLYESSFGGYYRHMVNARFCRSFLGLMLGLVPHYKYFEQDDPELYISKVRYILENNVDDMGLTFTEEEYSSGSANNNCKVSGEAYFCDNWIIELIPNGKKQQVTNSNKEEYLNLLAEYRLSTRVKREMESFLKGLSDLVPDGLLDNFDEHELEMLLCGKSTFSVEDLKAHHVQTGNGEVYIRTLPWFWTSVVNMTDDERARLLQFTTGSSLLPHGGFKELQPMFRITILDTAGKLPVAHTCFNEICLSSHRNFEEFERSLKLAIVECGEGFAIM